MSSKPLTKTREAAPHSGSYFPALDTTRAIGAIAVLATHTAFWSGAYLRHGVWGTLLARLDVGVAIFFVLSGFLLSRQWLLRRVEGRPLPSVPDYFWKRFLRIYPVYLIGIIPALIWVEQNTELGPTQWVTNLLMVGIYFAPLPHGMTQMWSLATEVAFYLVLPALIWLLVGRGSGGQRSSGFSLRTSRMGLILVALVLINFAWFPLISDAMTNEGGPNMGQWLPAYLSWFAVGIALAWAHLRLTHGEGPIPAPVRWLQLCASAPWSCYVIAGALLLFTSTPVAGPVLFELPTAGEQIVKNVAYALIGALIILPAAFLQPSGVYRQIMTARVPRHLGLISYGIFCIHLPLLSFVYWATPYKTFTGHGWEVFFITLLLSVIAAELIHRLVELPSNRLRNVFRPRSQREPESTSISS